MALTVYDSGDSGTRAAVVTAIQANAHAIGWQVAGQAGAGIIRPTTGKFFTSANVKSDLTSIDASGILVRGNAGLGYANGSFELAQIADDAAMVSLFGGTSPVPVIFRPNIDSNGNTVEVVADSLQLICDDTATTNPFLTFTNSQLPNLSWQMGISGSGNTFELLNTINDDGTGVQTQLAVARGGRLTCSGGITSVALVQINATGANSLAWQSDNAGDIGSAGANRPRSIYAGSRVVGGKSTVAAASTTTLDASTADTFLVTLGTNITTLSITNPVDGQTIQIIWRQDGTGGRTVAFPASIKGATAPSSTASSTSAQAFVYDSVNSVWYALGAASTGM